LQKKGEFGMFWGPGHAQTPENPDLKSIGMPIILPGFKLQFMWKLEKKSMLILALAFVSVFMIPFILAIFYINHRTERRVILEFLEERTSHGVT
jgi:hypothetical protein